MVNRLRTRIVASRDISFLPFALLALSYCRGRSGYSFPRKVFEHAITIAPGKRALSHHTSRWPNALLTLEEFGDYQCAPCGLLAATLLKVEHAYGTRVRVVFRQFPLVCMHTR